MIFLFYECNLTYSNSQLIRFQKIVNYFSNKISKKIFNQLLLFHIYLIFIVIPKIIPKLLTPPNLNDAQNYFHSSHWSNSK